jgi:phosphoserine phosphatase
MATQIILLRHGETEWNRVERFRGHYDIPLNATGLQQAARAAGWIAERFQPTAIYSSPLSRAWLTAEAVARACGLPVQRYDGLIDLNFGVWQGLTPAQVREGWPVEAADWYAHPERAQIPGGEALTQARRRIFAAMEETARQHTDETLVLVGHTHVLCLLLMAVLDIPDDHFWSIRLDNCAVSLVEKTSESYVVGLVNGGAH